LSLGFAIFITGWIGGELADVFKDEREVVFMIALFIPLYPPPQSSLKN
jgi:predicted MFS family arabinose efflux permease